MNDAERELFKRTLNRAQLFLHDYYCFMRTHDVEAYDQDAEDLARFLLETFDVDAEVILSGHLVAQSPDEGQS